MLRAAIDLGTVTSRLLLAEVNNAGLTELCREIKITNMGEGVARSGEITEAAITRVSAALVDFLSVIAGLRAQYAPDEDTADCSDSAPLVVATSALRDAKNHSQVLDRLAELGLKVEVISGRREAYLSFLGTLSGFTDMDGTVISVDVGGGSAEVICGDQNLLGQTNRPTESKLNLSFAHSFDVGARRVSDLFLASDPPTVREIKQARSWIYAQIAPKITALLSTVSRPEYLIAVAGSATSAIAMRDQLEPYDPKRVHGAKISVAELEELISRLSTLPLVARQNVVGLDPARAPVILGGLLCLAEIANVIGLSTLTISETDILQGILLDRYLHGCSRGSSG